MAEVPRVRRSPLTGALRWGSLVAAITVAVVFIIAQRQTVDVSYGESPTGSSESVAGPADDATDTGANDGIAEIALPSVAEMNRMVAAAPVVRLPGSYATWDDTLVDAAIGDADVRILVAPAGLTDDQQSLIRDVEGVTVRILGTEVSGGIYAVSADSVGTWRAEFGTGDVTSLLVTLIEALADAPQGPDIDLLTRRGPTAAELAIVTADLQQHSIHIATGATLDRVPDSAATAFPHNDLLVVALPRQTAGTPLPEFGPALQELFPDRPIVVMYGSWIEYTGPQRVDFADLATGSFYGQFGDILNAAAYPQTNVLNAYLNRVTDIRYAGLFERPLPYEPWDPLRVALPALPWVFAACAVVFVVLSARSVAAAGRRSDGQRTAAVPARLAGLTALAIEMSGLTGASGRAALTRGIASLGAARSALTDELPAADAMAHLDDAEAEFDSLADDLDRDDYRPRNYLRGRLG